MLKNLLKGILSTIVIKRLAHYRHLSIQLLKIEAAKSYLHGVRLVRLSALGLMGMGLVISLIFVGVLLFHAGLFILLPWPLEAKAVLGICLGMVYMVIGGLVLCAAMKEKTWMQKSGASELLKEATEQIKLTDS